MSSKVWGESVSGCGEENGGMVKSEDAEKDDSFVGHWPVPLFQTTLERNEPGVLVLAPMKGKKSEQKIG
jgi:hypothetical protein